MRRTILSFLASRNATAAVEFTLVAPVFFLLVFSAFEAGWIMTKSTLLDRAVDKTVRAMRIGGAGAPTTQDAIKQAICDAALVIGDCHNAMTVELRQIATASDFPSTNAVCVDRGATVKPTVSFNPSKPASIMYLRACVVTDPLTPGIGMALDMRRDSRGGYSLVSLSAFLNEPGT